MPVNSSQIRQLLATKRKAFTDFDRSTFQVIDAYRRGWKRCCQLSDQELPAAVPLGARPLETKTPQVDGMVRSTWGWSSREESLAWVRQVLTDVTTFAVDGSQIFPSKDISLPIALIQIGWFENPHSPSGHYDKDIRLEVMTPQDLQVSNQGQPADRRVNIRRFELEIERLIEYMQTYPCPQRCLVFFDGALVVTFAEAFDADSRDAYVKAMTRLLAVSAETRVPLVGYVDTSYARDLTTLVQHQAALPECDAIHDAQLLNPLMNWGDRTALYRCDRGGILDLYGEQCDRIAFCYLKTTREGYPARLEMPSWIWEDGRLDALIDWVRAEVVVGSGYPYAIETADQTAVLQAQDRHIFFRSLQDWAQQSAVNLRFSRKMASKLRRR
ncbi:hypothetical protein XM38_015970 [Halomicronema hongdechloris C2206]|uniref:NurA domain-containing protein n=1 Tax=Halomicronema hongdechloris C2206 TaxID=1641165 RepID=A0A1Z3HKN7_9CYAN|nr:DNA double-strand break repair nuclease NurA [Halomicronema hongdechloris]ASC70657.1 hypothetical protein XM38_015970 [Halomicronema hongdechloris C2206]